MGKYFAYDYDGPAFELFGTGHLVSIAIIVGIIVFLIWGWKNPSERAKKNTRTIMGGALILAQLSWYGWNMYHGEWKITEHLPLHLCAVLIPLAAVMLFTKNYQIYEVAYFLGIAGASQVVLTPEAGPWGLPHFRAVETLFSHGTLIIALVYMTTIEGFRPTWGSIGKSFLYGNIYMLILFPINRVIGSNYMYIMGKPTSASLMDVMGPWPWYLLTLQLVALIMFVLLYLPFLIKDRRKI